MVIPGNASEYGTDLISRDGCTVGCTDVNADNYDASVNISDNSLCEYSFVQGCMDEAACNYDAAAEQDDGSCTYAAEGLDCDFAIFA